MKALIKTAKGKGNIEVRELPVPKIQHPDWVLIKVVAAGVCGTDLHIWQDEFPYWPPVVMGHEFAGEVVEVGSAVSAYKPGDRVVCEPHSLACGTCHLCRQGIIQLCKDKRSPGWGIDGGFAEYVTMPAMLLHRIPDNMSYDMAALAEPMAIAVHQVTERSRVECQDFVVVSGAGPVGILAAFVAKAAGAAKVVVTGLSSCEDVRFPVARELGADVTLNVEKEDAYTLVMDMTNGQGADLVVETSGAQQAIAQSIQMTKICGRLCVIGIPAASEINVPWKSAVQKSLDMAFCMSSGYTAWDKALSLMANTPKNLLALITHKESFGNWENLFCELAAERGIKGLFCP